MPSGATALALQTRPPATAEERQPNWACPMALLGPFRMLHDDDAIAFEYLDGTAVELTFPRGFSGRLLDGQAELVAPDGSVIAREGDELDELVGDTRDICTVNGVTYPPAS